jgi:exodeoxyribonuclease V gamma subunit
MHLSTAERVEPLAERLAEVLATTPTDPMTPEWVVVPTSGMQRWLSLELARHLGSAGPGAHDGIAANIEFAYPGSLRLRVLEAGRAADDPDPWLVDHLVWAILAIADHHATNPQLTPLTTIPPGGSRYSTARRIADLFDRYHVHRPQMIRHWAAGRPLDDSGRPLPDHHLWQPRLWQLVRQQLPIPSPPERMPELLEQVRTGALALDLPPRLVLFGLTTLPGGTGFLDLVHAVTAQHDLHLFLLEPCLSIVGLTTSGDPSPRPEPRLRSDDRRADHVQPPLLRSWGRLPRETAVLLADATETWLPHAHAIADSTPDDRPDPAINPARPSLLHQLQIDIRAGQAPTATVTADHVDESIQFHAGHGSTRQVEILRDAILHLLADPELDLDEDDIVVMCPSLERFAPLVEAGFGPSADRPPSHAPLWTAHAPALRYRIADRSIGTSNPVLEATVALLELVAGRFDAPAVLDFIASTPIRERFRFSDDDLARIADWVTTTNVRWGLDPEHRATLGVPASITNNTWRAALDRLLVGAAVYDDGLTLAVGDVVAMGIEGDDADLAGRLADLLWRLGQLADQTTTARPVDEWVMVLREALNDLFAAPPDEPWQLQTLPRLLASVVERSQIDGDRSTTRLNFVDVRRLLADQLRGAPGRPNFFRGGITVTSMTPLRWIPYRVVCLLGMDQSSFSTGAADGDDLAAANPQLGDRDPRGETRQAMLEAVLAAGEHLIVVRDGHDVRTNHEILPAVAVAELIDAVTAMIVPDDRALVAETIEIHHPRQPFDERCFAPDGLSPLTRGPWSFDPGALASAEARRWRDPVGAPVFEPVALMRLALADVQLVDLHKFLKHPGKGFLEQRLRLRLPWDNDPTTALLPVAFDGLDLWRVGDRLLDALLTGHPADEWIAIEQRRGTLPPGVLGEAAVGELIASVDELHSAALDLGYQPGPGEPMLISVDLGDGTKLTGTVTSHLDTAAPGPARVEFTRPKPAHHIAAWLDLVALAAHDPATPWRSVAVNRGKANAKKLTIIDLVLATAVDPLGDQPNDGPSAIDAHEAIGVAVDLYRRGLAEPIPLFARFSPGVRAGHPVGSDWQGYDDRGDGNDAFNFPFYGHLDMHDLMALEAVDGDPAGTGGRVACYADYLWDAVDRSVATRPVPADDPDQRTPVASS